LKALIWIIVLVVLIGGAFGGWRWKIENDRKWREEAIPMKDKVARVPEFWTARFLAQRLQKTGKIRDTETFLAAAKEVGLEQVAIGGYILPEKASPRDLAKIFKDSPDLVKITFPEGWTAHKMAERLKANKFASAAQFETLAYPPGTVVSPLEGSLFPETYQLPVRGSAKELAQILQKRFGEIAAKLPKKAPLGRDDKPLTQREIVTLASLVERETSEPSERALVAGVLMNRLRKGMRLQCDASVQYVRERMAAQGKLKEGHRSRTYYRDLELASPYNTYRHKGLPPGPICNPGEAALRAAAAPKFSPYFFYVMNPSAGRHLFAKTFDEHKRNIRLAGQ